MRRELLTHLGEQWVGEALACGVEAGQARDVDDRVVHPTALGPPRDVVEQGVEDLVAAACPPGQQVEPGGAVEEAAVPPVEVTERRGVGGVEERGLERLH